MQSVRLLRITPPWMQVAMGMATPSKLECWSWKMLATMQGPCRLCSNRTGFVNSCGVQGRVRDSGVHPLPTSDSVKQATRQSLQNHPFEWLPGGKGGGNKKTFNSSGIKNGLG